ncbi:hypothetical protein RB195_016377 [Necator americanus]|uniref:Gamma-glutamyltransferase n=1 Tax=Necator americanus TaxID=51031 RepID=A0ABR1E8V7_NECAM
MSHYEKAYNPPEDIQELRAKGLPWVVATCLLVIVVLSGVLFYFVAAAELSADINQSTVVPSIGYEVEFLDTESSPTQAYLPNLTSTKSSDDLTQDISTEWTSPPARSASRKFLHATVTCRNEYCAEIGRDVLIRGGNAVDSAIATVVCTGAVHPHASGFGGGLMMIIHKSENNETIVINAASSAPRSAKEETFLAYPSLAKLGFSSIATPGFLHGIWTAYKRFGSGKIAWQDLLMPTVNLLERGYPIDADFIAAVQNRFHELIAEKSMNPAYATLTEGTIFHDPVHSHFLRRLSLAADPSEFFYRGEISNQIIHEMKQRGGLLIKADLAGYETKIEKPHNIKLPNGFSIKGPTLPSSFLAIGIIVEIMMKISLDVNYLRDLLMAQRTALLRLEKSGDPDFAIYDPVVDTMGERRNNTLDDSDENFDEKDVNKLLRNLKKFLLSTNFWKQEDFVGSHINVIDREHLAVALGSTINNRFGSVRRFEKGGFLWNNAMSGFTIYDKEDSEDMHVNAVEGRKRPRTSMSPFMLFDANGKLLGCYGTTGSLNSILGISQVLLHYMLFDMDLKKSVDAPRIFATLEGAAFESGFQLNFLSELRAALSVNPMLLTDSVVHPLELLEDGTLLSVCDFRDGTDQCARGF